MSVITAGFACPPPLAHDLNSSSSWFSKPLQIWPATSIFGLSFAATSPPNHRPSPLIWTFASPFRHWPTEILNIIPQTYWAREPASQTARVSPVDPSRRSQPQPRTISHGVKPTCSALRHMWYQIDRSGLWQTYCRLLSSIQGRHQATGRLLWRDPWHYS
jgi:hypothetical protein